MPGELIAINKVHELGGSLAVTLPNIWVEENGVKKGDNIKIYKRNDMLTIEKA